VFASKTGAAAVLHGSTAPAASESLVLYSSGAGTFGSIGQSNYAAANTALDSLALYRQICGLPASSLQPINVGGIGMAQAANDAGLHHQTWSLGLDQYVATLAGLLAGGRGVHLPLPCDLLQMAAYMDAYAWEQLTMQPLFSDLAPGAKPAAKTFSETVDHLSDSQENAPVIDEWRSNVNELILGELRELIGTGAALVMDISLMEAGLDSFGTNELTSRLRTLTGMAISPTLVFEQPTARAISLTSAGAVVAGAAGDDTSTIS
jgi:polyketide synthase 12